MKNLLITLGMVILVIETIYHNQPIKSKNIKLTQFEAWAKKYNKRYNEAEKSFRQHIYENNLEMIENHNSNSQSTYQMKDNHFADLTEEEFIQIYLTLQTQNKINLETWSSEQLPQSSIDWSNLTKVKDQGFCGSSWAFSAIGAIESVFRVKGSGTLDLSEQQLIDCDKTNYGCDGGYEDKAITWAKTNGLVINALYPYLGVSGTCKYSVGNVKPKGVQSVLSSNVQNAVSNYPVTAQVDASKWIYYSTGIFNTCAKSVNHAILLVGYTQDGVWIVKNSWGSDWGENGFIRLSSGNTCGITSNVHIAIL